MTIADGTVLVTGAGGFVGSAVVRTLVAAITERPLRFWDDTHVEHVVALLRPGSSSARLEELEPMPAWSVARADVSNPEELRSVVRATRPRAVLHLALDRAAYRLVDDAVAVAPMATLVDALAEVPGARLVHTSSAWILRGGTGLEESAPVEPRSPYAQNKARADRALPALAERAGVSWLTLRPFNTFGKYEDATRLLPHLVSRLAAGETAALSHGNQVRDFTEVGDVARAYVCALAAPAEACGAVYHIGSGRATTTREFAAVVADVLGASELLEFGAVETPDQGLGSLVANPARARAALGWSVAVPLETRIRETVSWWLERRATHHEKIGASEGVEA